MAYVYGGAGGPFAWLWCLLYFDLLSRIYGPWVPFIISFVLAATMLVGLIVLAVASNTQPNESASDSTYEISYQHAHSYDDWWLNTKPSDPSNATAAIARSHAYYYTYEFWWFELIFLATFVIILVVPVVHYNSDPQPYKRDGVAPGVSATKKSDQENRIEPQRPLLSLSDAPAQPQKPPQPGAIEGV